MFSAVEFRPNGKQSLGKDFSAIKLIPPTALFFAFKETNPALFGHADQEKHDQNPKLTIL